MSGTEYYEFFFSDKSTLFCNYTSVKEIYRPGISIVDDASILFTAALGGDHNRDYLPVWVLYTHTVCYHFCPMFKYIFSVHPFKEGS